MTPEVDFREIHDPAGLARLDRRFLDDLRGADPALAARLVEYRDGGRAIPPVETSEILLAAAPHLEAFIARLFGVRAELDRLRVADCSEQVVQAFKKELVLKRARRYRGDITESFAQLDAWIDTEMNARGMASTDREAAVADLFTRLLEKDDTCDLERLTKWCVLAMSTEDGRTRVGGWSSFHLPASVDHDRLVPLAPVEGDPAGRTQSPSLRPRDGFVLTDPRMTRREVLGEVHYCIYCHDHDGDFCSKGFPVKKGDPAQGLKKNPLGVTLTGCPLEEKISEMHTLKREGSGIAALAMAMVDNPMVPATGHRICNDCMKGCIYQKKDPVDIPQIETRVLTDVLALPWGVEIYDLLTRWNPLRREQYVMKPYNGRRVLISGLGPAGFTMAHHLTMEGCAVVGIDGLKIEPLPRDLVERPVRDYASLEESLDERILAGFGGVAEYGITVRWDKNFLKLIYLSLARRATFQAFGGVRLGGTVTLDDAWNLGFDHLCIANGAGLPHVVPMGNSLARGMRQANDFLMALQLTGAAKRTSLANLQVRLPAVVIGGGLTAIDTATEVQAYYIAQVEKTLERHEELTTAHGEEYVRGRLDPEGRSILEEMLAHGRAVRAEREHSAAQDRRPDFIPLLREWGGVTLVYRRTMNESPAYLRNHEEITKAMQEGIFYLEALEPERAVLDEHGHVKSLVCRRRERHGSYWTSTGEDVALPARSVFVAAGATPNTIYEREHPGTLALYGNHFKPHENGENGLVPVDVGRHCKVDAFGPFTSYASNDRRVSFLGDTHPVFHGSVVKAIASAKRSCPEVMRAIERRPRDPGNEDAGPFMARMRGLLLPTVASVDSSHPSVVELRVRAPMAARNFKAGQFFRLQTFESLSPVVHGTRLQVPLQTVSGAGVDGDTVRLMVLRFGANPRLIERLRPGDPLVLMGPTGAPADIGSGRTVLVLAGKWGAAVMLDLGRAMRAAGNRVLLFAAFGQASEVYHQDELEANADQIVWATARGEPIAARRPQDASVQASDLVSLLGLYGEREIGPRQYAIPLKEVDEILVMGSTSLLRGMRGALKDKLRHDFREDVDAVGTVGSPMQCMLKGVCAQCLQWQVDPETGERTEAVFSCAQQDQPLFAIDLENLAARQSQNRMQEQLTNLWLEHVLEQEREEGGKD
jgi:NADPH-dependent glutamate synthase beta subunit-like oxidoreductase/NAD(P)H-flavin reductase